MPPSWAAIQRLDSGFFFLLLTSAGPGQRSGVSWGQERTHPVMFQDWNWKQHPCRLATHLLRSCHPTGSSGLRCPGVETLFSRENAHCPMCAGSAGGKWRSTSLHPQILHICQATAGGGPGSQKHARWLAGGALGAWQGLPFPG